MCVADAVGGGGACLGVRLRALLIVCLRVHAFGPSFVCLFAYD